MKTGVRILDPNFHQGGLDLKVGTYTYSVTVRPVNSYLAFRVGDTYYYIYDLVPNQLTDVSLTFELTTPASTFYPSVTVGDEIFEPQPEQGTNSSSRQPNPADAEDMMEEIGLRIDDEMATIYARSAWVTSSINTSIGEVKIYVDDKNSDTMSEIVTRTDSISLRVDNLSDGLAATGINIEDKKITITSNNTIFLSNNGALNALFSSNHAKIKADLIEFEGLVTTANNNFKILADGSIEARNGKFTGVIEALSGKIGGFFVSGQTLTNLSGGVFNTDAAIVLRNDSVNTFAAIGGNVLPVSTGLTAVARFENNREAYYSYNYALIVGASNSLSPYDNHAIAMLSGAISGLAIKTRQVSTSTYLTHADVYVSCYNTSSISIYLPSNPVIGKILFVRRVNTAAITLNGNGKIIHWGAGSGNTKSAGEGIGDTAVLIYDGQYWMYNYWIRS